MSRWLHTGLGAVLLPALLALPASAASFKDKGVNVAFKTSDGQDAGTATLNAGPQRG